VSSSSSVLSLGNERGKCFWAAMKRAERERVLFIGTRFSNLYTAVDTPARSRVIVCLVFVCLVFVCKYVIGHSRVSQPLNLRLCLLRHLGFLTSPCASPPCRRRRLNSYRLLHRPPPGGRRLANSSLHMVPSKAKFRVVQALHISLPQIRILSTQV
jgi:hypothetical protein